MKLWITLASVAAVLIIGLIILFALYVLVVSGAANIGGLGGVLRTESSPPPPEVLARNQATREKIEESIEDQEGFYLELTDEELTSLLASRLAPNSQIRDVEVHTTPDEIQFSGSLNGVVPVPCSGSVDVEVDRGEINLSLTNVSVGVVGVPGGVQEDIENLINQAIDLDELFRQHGATLVQQVRLEEGKTIVVGVQKLGVNVSDDLQSSLNAAVASSGSTGAPEPPGADIVPLGNVAGTSKLGDEVYLALGDSLAANVGVNDAREGYVSRFHGFLERETGRSLGLQNLGISGESSVSIYQGQLGQALNEIERLKSDANPDTRVAVVTIDLGANDLLGHVKSRDCISSPAGPACQSRIDAGLGTFRENYSQIIPELQLAIEPNTEFYVMTVYNPFGLGTSLPLENLSDDVTDRLNRVIKNVAEENGVRVADVRPVMGRNAGSWTNILAGDIHPNGKGYQAMAYTLTQSRQ